MYGPRNYKVHTSTLVKRLSSVCQRTQGSLPMIPFTYLYDISCSFQGFNYHILKVYNVYSFYNASLSIRSHQYKSPNDTIIISWLSFKFNRHTLCYSLLTVALLPPGGLTHRVVNVNLSISYLRAGCLFLIVIESKPPFIHVLLPGCKVLFPFLFIIRQALCITKMKVFFL